MTTSSKKLGIIAGGGCIPRMLIEHCKAVERDYFVLAIDGNADQALIDDSVPHQWIRIGQAGTGFKRLHDEKVEEVIMIGTIKRPGFFDLVPDLRTAAFFAKIGAKSLGDDGILRALVSEIEAEGMKVKGIHEVMEQLLAKNGVLGKVKPSKQAVLDIKRGIEVALALGSVDVGQAVVVQQGLVLAVEGIEGTDKLLLRCKDYKRKGEGGVLVKLRKLNQDVRIDLPTIGVETLKRAKECGLSGIVVHTGNGLIIDEAEVIKFANKEGMFVIGVDPFEYAQS